MDLQMFTVYDSVAAAFLPPFYLHNQSMAQRAFSDSIKDKGHAFNKNPADYTLFYVGIFKDSTGEIISQLPEAILSGNEIRVHEVEVK